MKMDLFDLPHRQEPKSTAPGESRSLPFSEDGEKGVLCSLLLSPRDVLDLCQIKLRPEAFYAPARQILYNLVAELVDSNKPIDFITLKQALKDRAQLDEIGGPEYLSDLFSFVPSAANADYYIDIIREKYLLRQTIMTCNRVVSDCYDHREEVDALLDRVEHQIFSITSHNTQIDVRLQNSSSWKPLMKLSNSTKAEDLSPDSLPDSLN